MGKRILLRGHETITGSPANFELGCERPVRWILLSLFLPPFPLSFFRSCFVVARVHTRPTHTSRFFGIRETSSRAVIFGVIAANRDLDLCTRSRVRANRFWPIDSCLCC